MEGGERVATRRTVMRPCENDPGTLALTAASQLAGGRTMPGVLLTMAHLRAQEPG